MKTEYAVLLFHFKKATQHLFCSLFAYLLCPSSIFFYARPCVLLGLMQSTAEARKADMLRELKFSQSDSKHFFERAFGERPFQTDMLNTLELPTTKLNATLGGKLRTPTKGHHYRHTTTNSNQRKTDKPAVLKMHAHTTRLKPSLVINTQHPQIPVVNSGVALPKFRTISTMTRGLDFTSHLDDTTLEQRELTEHQMVKLKLVAYREAKVAMGREGR